MTSNTTQLEEAKQKLEELRSELPRYHSLLTDTQQHEVELQRQFRAGTGKFSDLTEAKNATMTARELFEQHQADIQSAQAEVSRLEAAVERERAQKAYVAAQQAFEQTQEAWRDQALDFMVSLEEQAAKLYRLEARAQTAWHPLDEASKAVGKGTPALGFYLYPVFKDANPTFTHEGNGTIMFDLQPGKRPYLRLTVAPQIPHVLHPRD